MFKDLINLMSEGRSYSRQELSCKLGVSEETLQSFIEYRSKKGLLSQVNLQQNKSSCTGDCVRCKGGKRCGNEQAFKSMPTLWEFKKS